MNRLPFLGLLFALLCLVACRQMNEAHLLHLAEKQVNMNVDSVYALLVQIERPSQLSDEERLLYGWLNAYVHYKRHNSMAEDSLILPASDYLLRLPQRHGEESVFLSVESLVLVLAERARTVYSCH